MPLRSHCLASGHWVWGFLNKISTQFLASRSHTESKGSLSELSVSLIGSSEHTVVAVCHCAHVVSGFFLGTQPECDRGSEECGRIGARDPSALAFNKTSLCFGSYFLKLRAILRRSLSRTRGHELTPRRPKNGSDTVDSPRWQCPGHTSSWHLHPLPLAAGPGASQGLD